MRRQEIVEYLEERGIGWCEDSSNGEKAYTRNRIRGDLIPYMIRYVNERTPENILHAGGLIGQADRYLRGQAEKVWEDAGQRMNFGVSIGSRVFLGQEPIIRSYLIRLMLDITAPGHKNITAKHFEQIERLVQGPVGGDVIFREVCRPGEPMRSLSLRSAAAKKKETDRSSKIGKKAGCFCRRC